jgi:hypothetical protein
VDFCKDCIQLGAEKEADVKLSHIYRQWACHVQCSTCVMIVRVVAAVKKRRQEINVSLNSAQLYWSAQRLWSCWVIFFSLHTIDKQIKQNILNLELVLFHLKCTTSTKQLSVTDFCPEKVICKHMKWNKCSLLFL